MTCALCSQYMEHVDKTNQCCMPVFLWIPEPFNRADLDRTSLQGTDDHCVSILYHRRSLNSSEIWFNMVH
ncbi:hypothetical protein F2P79_011205 [Pimephales promelas]|nr:hypothetical protein F2P79_011205 [Pimephales promelas]